MVLIHATSRVLMVFIHAPFNMGLDSSQDVSVIVSTVKGLP